MAPIPIHTQSPITASKPSGITPRTALPPQPTNASTPTSTTAVASPSYPSAQPGPTPTLPFASPPAPQPGAVPHPTPTARRPSIPPPPKAGEKPHPPAYYAKPTPTPTPSQPYPPQMSIPPPTTSIGGVPPASTTATSTTPSQPFASQAEKGGRERALTLEHPEGYVQDVHAQEMTAGAREGVQRLEGREVLPGFGDGKVGGGGEQEGGVWGKVKGVVQSVGEGVGRLEEEVWRRVGKE